MVQAGLKAIYGSGWQVAADGNTAGDVYPDQSLYPCDSAPNLVKRINRALLRADQIESAEGKTSRDVLVRADRRGRGSGLRRFAERVRADESDDRSGRGGRAFRRPAFFREEVRASGRESGGAHARVHREADGGAAGRGRLRRADDSDCAHGRELGRAAAFRRRPARPRVHLRRAHARRLLPVSRRHRRGDCARPGVRAVRRHAVVRNFARRTWRKRRNSPTPFTRNSRANCWRTTVRRRSTGRKSSTT